MILTPTRAVGLSVADDLTAFSTPAASVFAGAVKHIARSRSLTGLACRCGAWPITEPTSSPIVDISPMGGPWRTLGPFCVWSYRLCGWLMLCCYFQAVR